MKVGDEVCCMFCGKKFAVKNVTFDWNGEYLTCPHCNQKSGIDYYLLQESRPDERLIKPFTSEEIDKSWEVDEPEEKSSKVMKPETVDLILAMFRKEEALWRISLLDHDCENVREKLANVRTAEADFKKAVGD